MANQVILGSSDTATAGERRIFIAALATTVTVATGLLVALYLALREYVIRGADWLI